MSTSLQAPVAVDEIDVHHPRSSTGDKAVSTTAHVLLIVWAVIVILPLLWTILTSLKTTSEIFSSPFGLPKTIQWINFKNAWTTAQIGDFFLNTIVVVFSALIIVMVLGAMSAYVLARYRFHGNKLIYTLFLAGNTFPIFLAVVPLFFTLKNMGLLNTIPGLIITYVAFALPFTVFFLYAFFKTLPFEIYEAAQIDGAGEWRTFFSVMLPMAKPGFASVAIFNFLGLWNQYLIPVALNTRTDNYVLSQGLAAFASRTNYEVDYGALFAAVVLTVLPVLIVYVIFQRQLQGSVSQGTMK
ncbi:carbohydrate ABC transporter permease [Acidipropionibacterium virtanenii]|uniref:Trehalose transport system permease protein SugB n=1 Tax=Acidipropionibacterium virtanenii TaxID=2057246 RepID=A0A344UPS4_9ACTN|nr:carbohydrate ABC transporter permease [Acidipropionibacterium virtanenii]AXE37272.1 Trehalose transport system permease protein SugB [Acidipropionibacterium virtanenii]